MASTADVAQAVTAIQQSARKPACPGGRHRETIDAATGLPISLVKR